MARALRADLPLKGFGPNRDGKGFGSITRSHEAVMSGMTGLPSHLMPAEDLDAVELMIKSSASGAREKRRRLRKEKRRGSTESGAEISQRTGRSQSTPLLRGSSALDPVRGNPPAVSPKKSRRHKTAQPDPLTRRQFDAACGVLHLPNQGGDWLERLPQSDKLAMRRVLERNGARAAMTVADIEAPAEPSASKRVAQRVTVEKDAFEIVLARNRRVRAQSGRPSGGRSRRARLLNPSDDSDDADDKDDVSALFRTDKKDVRGVSPGRSPGGRQRGGDAGTAQDGMNAEQKLALLDFGPVVRDEPSALWLGHIPDDAVGGEEWVDADKKKLENRLRKLCSKFGDITGVVAHPRFDDPDCSRLNGQSWAVVTFKPGTMGEMKDILAAKVMMGEKYLQLQLAEEDFVKKPVRTKSVNFGLSREDSVDRTTVEEEMENYTKAKLQIEQRKVEALAMEIEELPDIGEDDPNSGGMANEAAALDEGIQMWIGKLHGTDGHEGLMEHVDEKGTRHKGTHTLKLPGYGMGDGGSASLLAAICSIEEIDVKALKDHDGEVPEPKHVFKRLILSGNALAPTDDQVSFQWKDPDFLFRNPDFVIRNPDFLLKNVEFNV